MTSSSLSKDALLSRRRKGFAGGAGMRPTNLFLETPNTLLYREPLPKMSWSPAEMAKRAKFEGQKMMTLRDMWSKLTAAFPEDTDKHKNEHFLNEIAKPGYASFWQCMHSGSVNKMRGVATLPFIDAMALDRRFLAMRALHSRGDKARWEVVGTLDAKIRVAVTAELGDGLTFSQLFARFEGLHRVALFHGNAEQPFKEKEARVQEHMVFERCLTRTGGWKICATDTIGQGLSTDHV
jgi:hypothetical protein